MCRAVKVEAVKVEAVKVCAVAASYGQVSMSGTGGYHHRGHQRGHRKDEEFTPQRALPPY